jgi:hypothetical protein
MGYLLMNDKERLCKAIMEMVRQKKLKLATAAIQLEISYRQAKRIYKRYKAEGDAGLTHKGRGQISYRKHPHREKIIARYKERYEGFGPTLASEKLAEDDGLFVDHETLRLWLLDEHMWKKQRKRPSYRSRRDRRAQFGELIQVDGSHHDWLEDGQHRCLLNMVDDATGKTLSRLDEEETTRSVFLLLQQWINRYGIPLALYVDLKNIYVSPKNKGFGHLERACSKLGIRIIKAYSPQAKGRVERNHAVYQDRFVKELRLRNVKTVEEANAVLTQGFIDHLNEKFEKLAVNPKSAHRTTTDIDLDNILCWEYMRQVQHDWTFSFHNQYYQIKKAYGSIVRPKVYICLRKHMDGSLSAWYEGEKLSISHIDNKKTSNRITKTNIISLSDRARLSKEKSPWNKTMHGLFDTFPSKKKY